MKSKAPFYFFIFFLLLLHMSFAYASDVPDDYEPDKICITYFYGDGCPHCAATKPFLDEIEQKYGDKIQLYRYEVYHDTEAFKKYNEFCSVQNIPLEKRGVPMLAIGENFYMGEDQIRANLEKDIEDLLDSGERICPISGTETCSEINQTGTKTDPLIPDLKSKITMPVVIGTGLIDGINPCAIGVIIFLASFLIMVSSSRRKILTVGSVYILSVYVTYLLAGVGLLYVLSKLSSIRFILIAVFGAILVIAGLINIKDYFFYGKGFSLKIPESKKDNIKKWVNRASIPSAIILGFLVSAWELPCTGGVYLGILALMSDTLTKMQAFWYLLVYNVMFVLPLIIIMFMMAYGVTEEHIQKWVSKHKKTMKLVSGLVMIVLAVIMFLFVK